MAKFEKQPDGTFVSGVWQIVADRTVKPARWIVKRVLDSKSESTHDTLREAKQHVGAMLGEGPIALRLYGHQVNVNYDKTPGVELHEVSIIATPEGLRVLGQHLIDQAAAIERSSYYDHGHFQPEVRPEIVVIPYTDDTAGGDIEWDDELNGFAVKS